MINLKTILFEADAAENANSADPLREIEQIAKNESLSLEKRVQQIMVIAQKNYREIGMGSNRTTFDLSSDKALKVSYAASRTYSIQDSISQTTEEAKVCEIAKKADLIPEIYQIGHDYLYLVIEKVVPVGEGNQEKISSHFGFKTFEEFTNALLVVANKGAGATPEQIAELKKKRDFVIAVTTMQQCKYAIADMTNPENWGIDKSGRPVMLDTGLVESNRESIVNHQKRIAKDIAGQQQAANKEQPRVGQDDRTRAMKKQ
jgi:hypothetical protein